MTLLVGLSGIVSTLVCPHSYRQTPAPMAPWELCSFGGAIDERDLRDAARRLDDYLAAKKGEKRKKPAYGYNSGTVTPEKLERTNGRLLL